MWHFNTIQYNTIQQIMIQHNTIQYNTILCNCKPSLIKISNSSSQCTIKILYKVEWKCVQVIKKCHLQSLIIQKSVSNLSHQYWLYYLYNSANYRKFWPYFTRFLLEIVSTLFTSFLLKTVKQVQLLQIPYNFQSIIVKSTQSKQK